MRRGTFGLPRRVPANTGLLQANQDPPADATIDRYFSTEWRTIVRSFSGLAWRGSPRR